MSYIRKTHSLRNQFFFSRALFNIPGYYPVVRPLVRMARCVDDAVKMPQMENEFKIHCCCCCFTLNVKEKMLSTCRKSNHSLVWFQQKGILDAHFQPFPLLMPFPSPPSSLHSFHTVLSESSLSSSFFFPTLSFFGCKLGMWLLHLRVFWGWN